MRSKMKDPWFLIDLFQKTELDKEIKERYDANRPPSPPLDELVDGYLMWIGRYVEEGHRAFLLSFKFKPLSSKVQMNHEMERVYSTFLTRAIRRPAHLTYPVGLGKNDPLIGKMSDTASELPLDQVSKVPWTLSSIASWALLPTWSTCSPTLRLIAVSALNLLYVLFKTISHLHCLGELLDHLDISVSRREQVLARHV
jgi:hypothetical protein